MAVVSGTTTYLGRGKQSAFVVHANAPHGGFGGSCQFIDGVVHCGVIVLWSRNPGHARGSGFNVPLANDTNF